MAPSLISYQSENDYRQHYLREYCRQQVFTADGIRVYFKPDRFNHAFYESNPGSGRKESFSEVRAERIDWIKETLANAKADLYLGWNKYTKAYENHRRVSVVYDDFVVVIELSLTSSGALKANFVTCYEADRSINKIRKAPSWNLEDCVKELHKKKYGR